MGERFALRSFQLEFSWVILGPQDIFLSHIRYTFLVLYLSMLLLFTVCFSFNDNIWNFKFLFSVLFILHILRLCYEINTHVICTNLRSHQQCTMVPFSPYPLQHSLLPVFWIQAIWTRLRWYTLEYAFACLWWSMILITFSYTCFPFVCIILRNIYSYILPI